MNKKTNSFPLCIGGVFASGILALISCGCLATFAVLSVIQMAMITSRDTVVMKYKSCIIQKLVWAVLGAILALAAAILFAIEIDESHNHFVVSRGITFYLQVRSNVID